MQAHRAALESRGYAPSTVNQRLAAIKKLAREAAANGLLDAAVAAAIDQVPGVKQSGNQGRELADQGAGRGAHQLPPTPPPSKGPGTARSSPCWSAAGCAAPKPWRSRSGTSSSATAAG